MRRWPFASDTRRSTGPTGKVDRDQADEAAAAPVRGGWWCDVVLAASFRRAAGAGAGSWLDAPTRQHPEVRHSARDSAGDAANRRAAASAGRRLLRDRRPAVPPADPAAEHGAGADDGVELRLGRPPG